MNIIVKLVMVALSFYTVGTLVGPVAVDAVSDAKESFSPFFVIALAMLIGSIGYAVGAVRRSPFYPDRHDQGGQYR